MRHRPLALLAIIFYKVFVATLFAITSIAIILVLKNHNQLQQFADAFILAGKQGLIVWTVEKILRIQPHTLRFSAALTTGYAAITSVEAVGLWLEKSWAKWLVIGIVAVSILPELYELIQGFSILKLLVLLINLVVLIYLLLQSRQKER
jgi:uncharacterized membrane protein (DUF2068 family)